jgi:hypothetical protein
MIPRENYIPGLLLDSRGHVMLTILSPDSVGVSTQRFDQISQRSEIEAARHSEEWILLFRNTSAMFLTIPVEDGITEMKHVTEFHGALANESAQFAIELALACWPGWGEDLRNKYRPCTRVISIPVQPHEA